jgi:hypothetical protein
MIVRARSFRRDRVTLIKSRFTSQRLVYDLKHVIEVLEGKRIEGYDLCWATAGLEKMASVT